MNLAEKADQCTINSRLQVMGLDCADCAARLEKRISKIPEVQSVAVNFATARMDVAYQGDLDGIIHAVEKMGYSAYERKSPQEPVPVMSLWRSNPYILPTMIALAFLITGLIAETLRWPDPVSSSFFGAGIILGGFFPARNGIRALIGTREVDMNILMTVAVLGAAGIGQFEEAAAVVFLFSLGNALQSYTLDKTRQSVRALMKLAPNEALLRRPHGDFVVSVEELAIGDIIVIKPGARVPMDGMVRAGYSVVNQAPITGESLPVEKTGGDEVYAGTINGHGALEVEVTRYSSDTAMARIIQKVEEAQASRAPAQQLVDRFASCYTPAVIGAAVLVAILPPVITGQAWLKWFYQALSMLLVACPCALVISTPVAIVSALGSAAQSGVLVKGGAFLEAMSSLSAVAFDKTGTLTAGRLKVTDVQVFNGYSEQELLSIAAAIEKRSEHPLAEAIVSFGKHWRLEMPPVEEFVSAPGLGASGEVKGTRYFIGSQRYIAGHGLDAGIAADGIHRMHKEGKSVVLLASQECIIGLLAVSDQLRPGARRAVESLKQAGISRTIMLTGDNWQTAAGIAEQAGIDEVCAGLLPEDKEQAVRDLINQYGKVAMIGDGVNDTPAMASATVGIAMGTAGTDAALETADIALMADDLQKLAYTVRLSRRTVSIIKQNLALAIIIKVIILLMVIPGWLTLWLAVVGDMGSSLLVILNGMRLLRMQHKG